MTDATLCWGNLSSTACVLLPSCMASPPTAPIRSVLVFVLSETQRHSDLLHVNVVILAGLYFSIKHLMTCIVKGLKRLFWGFFTVQLVTTEYLGSVNENIFVIWFFFKSQWNLFEIFFCSMCNKELIKSDRSVINSRLRCRPHHLSCARWDSCNIHHVATVPVTKA